MLLLSSDVVAAAGDEECFLEQLALGAVCKVMAVVLAVPNYSDPVVIQEPTVLPRFRSRGVVSDVRFTPAWSGRSSGLVQRMSCWSLGRNAVLSAAHFLRI